MAALTGCQTAPSIDYYKHSQGEFVIKTLIRDKENKESSVVNLKAYAIKDRKLRLNVTATLGIPVASLLLNENLLEYLLIQEKKYFSGDANGDALAAVIKMPLDPRVFYSVLFDAPISSKGWTCVASQKGLVPRLCRHLKTKITVKWLNVDGYKKIVIEHRKADIEMLFNKFSKKISEPKKRFSMRIPPSFKKINR